MSKMRNLFRRGPATDDSSGGGGGSPYVDVKITPAIEEPDYKLSSVSPDGQFIPPSPPEKQSFLSRFTHRGTNTNSHSSVSSRRSTSGAGGGSGGGSLRSRAGLDPDDDDDRAGFTIPRASFDGYRRSFDIRPSMDEQRPVTTSTARVPRSSFGGDSTAAVLQPPIISNTTTTSANTAAVAAVPLQKASDREAGADGSAADTFDDVDLNEAVVGHTDSSQPEEVLPAAKRRFWQKATAPGTASGGVAGGHASLASGDGLDGGAELHPYTPTQPPPSTDK